MSARAARRSVKSWAAEVKRVVAAGTVADGLGDVCLAGAGRTDEKCGWVAVYEGQPQH